MVFKPISSILDYQSVVGLIPDLTKVHTIPEHTAQEIQAVIFGGEGKILRILTTNNYPNQLKALITKLNEKGYQTEQFFTDTESFAIALSRYAQIKQQEQAQEQKKQAQTNASGRGALGMIQELYQKRATIEPEQFVMELVRLSFQAGASDLHFQPEEKGVMMKIRLDGILQQVVEFGHQEFYPFLQKLKFIAGTKMNIDYVPQDGRFSFQATKDGVQRSIDARVNFMPGIGSESTVIRYLDGSRSIQSFESIGFIDHTYTTLKQSLEATFGMILVTGPTGSGKTTSLYSMLSYLNDGKKKIITLEDPVEYQLSGIQQSQINAKKGYTYEEGLKAILRHDPEIILIGETRTLETAEIAINAALTGHLVLTTLHTNSALEAISRLLSMGVLGYILGPSLMMICGQRLTRRVCSCATRRPATFSEKEQISKTLNALQNIGKSKLPPFDGTVPHPVGCELCNHTGYKGRIAILETLAISEELKNAIIEGKPTIQLYGIARQQGFITLQEDGIIKMLQKKTTLDEIRRVS